MHRYQFSIRTLLWLTLSVATILTGWAMIDAADAARESGEVRFVKLG